MNVEKIAELPGKDSDYLLGFKTPKVKKDQLHIPSPDGGKLILRNNEPDTIVCPAYALWPTTEK